MEKGWASAGEREMGAAAGERTGAWAAAAAGEKARAWAAAAAGKKARVSSSSARGTENLGRDLCIEYSKNTTVPVKP